MLEELASRPIKRLAAGIASWLVRRMSEPMLQRIIQLREPQRAKLTPPKNARHFLKINKMKISVGLFLKPIVFHSSSWF